MKIEDITGKPIFRFLIADVTLNEGDEKVQVCLSTKYAETVIFAFPERRKQYSVSLIDILKEVIEFDEQGG